MTDTIQFISLIINIAILAITTAVVTSYWQYKNKNKSENSPHGIPFNSYLTINENLLTSEQKDLFKMVEHAIEKFMQDEIQSDYSYSLTPWIMYCCKRKYSLSRLMTIFEIYEVIENEISKIVHAYRNILLCVEEGLNEIPPLEEQLDDSSTLIKKEV